MGFLLVVVRKDELVKKQEFKVFEAALMAEAKRCSQEYGRLIELFVLAVKVKELKKQKNMPTSNEAKAIS